MKKNTGFSVDCETFIKQRKDSVSVVLDRPAHQVSWYPKSMKPMIRFFMRNMGVDVEPLLEDAPHVLKSSSNGIQIREKWSDTAVYNVATDHCKKNDRKARQTGEPVNEIYKFVCE